MNPGTLDRKLQIQRQAAGLFMVTVTGEYMTTADGERMTTGSRRGRFGAEVDAWGMWHTRMARRIESRGSEDTANGRERTAGRVVFRLRYTAGLLETDRVVDTTNGQAYDIEDFVGDRRHGWMDLHCTRYRTPKNANQEIES